MAAKSGSVDPLAPALPGLDVSPPPGGALTDAVNRTIEAYRRAGLVQDRHEALCELSRTLATVVTIGVNSRRSTGAAMAARELRETLAMLPQPVDGDGDTDAWEDFKQAMAEAEAAEARAREMLSSDSPG